MNAFFVDDAVSHAVEQNHALPFNTLREVFVWRTDVDPFDALMLAEALDRGREGIVSFEVHHGPHDKAKRCRRAFRQGKLRPQLGLDPFAGLVAVEHLVAKRFDHVIKRDCHVGHFVLTQQCDHRAKQATHRANFDSARPARFGCAEIRAIEFVGTVDQMKIHGRLPLMEFVEVALLAV